MAEWGYRWSRARPSKAREDRIKRLPLIKLKSCTVADGQVQDTSPAQKDGPGVTFSIAGRL